MRRWGRRGSPRAIYAGGLGAGLAACTLLTGVGDLEVESKDASAEAAAVETGTPTLDAGNPVQDSATFDAPMLGDEPPPVVDACSTAGCLPVPDGFTLVAVGAAGADCPGGYGSGVDGLIDPGVDPSGCTCGCSITIPGRCPSTGVVTQYNSAPDAGAVCTTEIGTLTGSGCQTDGFQGPFITNEYRKYIPPQVNAVGESCSGNANKDPSKAGGNGARVCSATVNPRCNGLVCPTDPGTGFLACIANQTGLDCPAAWPAKHQVGAGITFDCDGSGCGCAGATASCFGGTLSFYPTGDCSGPAGFTAPVNDGCIPTSATAGGPYASHLYTTNAPANEKCTANGNAAVVNINVPQATTVCCTQ